MSARYTRIPSQQEEQGYSEMEAAFDNSDDDDDDLGNDEQAQQRRPLVSARRDRPPSPTLPVGQYDFERIDYDYPPPGSPPRPSSMALPANAAYGNTNGLVPSSPVERPSTRLNGYRGWLSRAMPWADRRRVGPTARIGGGAENDGVFANLMSKPTRPRRIEDGDDTHVVPEESQVEAPPSYAAAQADQVPSYWDTTVHAPIGGDIAGELIVDSLPTGSLFSFLWSMLVSVAFNFLGFVLTYLLHTTHAAKYGSRAGLGITLIQYGWALRTRSENMDGSTDMYVNDAGEIVKPPPPHTSSNPTDLDAWRQQYGNGTMIPDPGMTGAYALGESAAAWLSFFLMTVGWFLFLSSILGFWRVKRWERGILNAQPHSDRPVHEEPPESEVPISFTFPGMFLREGLGLSTVRRQDEEEGNGERFVVQEIDRQRQIAEVRLNDARLQRNLRAAGLI